MRSGRASLVSSSCMPLSKDFPTPSTTTTTTEGAGEDADDGAGGDHLHPLHLTVLLRLSKAVGGEVGAGLCKRPVASSLAVSEGYSVNNIQDDGGTDYGSEALGKGARLATTCVVLRRGRKIMA